MKPRFPIERITELADQYDEVAGELLTAAAAQMKPRA